MAPLSRGALEKGKILRSCGLGESNARRPRFFSTSGSTNHYTKATTCSRTAKNYINRSDFRDFYVSKIQSSLLIRLSFAKFELLIGLDSCVQARKYDPEAHFRLVEGVAHKS